MRLMICLTGALALAACNKAAPPAENTATDVTATAPEAVPAALTTINETTWEFTNDGKPMQKSIDATGKYITVSGAEHIDHGTAVMKDGKICFTSAMTKDGEICWVEPMLAIGQSGESTNDKGEKKTITRTAYVPLTM